MRKIKFRGRHTHSKEWKVGYLVYIKVDSSYKIYNGNGLYYFVDHETIGQYTGLEDKNGKEIFEGDIVKIDTNDFGEQLFKVLYHCGSFRIELLNGKFGCVIEPFDMEIVGNIYDNPELLEVESE